MILKNLWRRPMRSLLTILGIAIGVATVVSLGAMAEGMVKNYGTAVGGSNDLLVIQANALDALFSTLDEEMALRMQAVPGVQNVDPGVYTWIATDEMPFFLIFGYEPGSLAAAHYRIVEGKPITGPKQIALGRRAAESLKKTVEDTVRLYGIPYRIVGIYETGQGMEESGGLVTLADSQDIAQKPRKVSLFQVNIRPNTDIDLVRRRIEALDKVLSVNKASEYDAAEQWAGLMQGYAWGIAAIAIVIGGLGMMNAMVMSVMERTREIGTLRALGWRRGQIVRMILGEAVLLSLVGGVIGIGIGVGLTELAASAPGVGAFMEGIYSPGLFAQGMITALFLGMIGGGYPAWRAAKLQPVEALRYEGGTGGGAGERDTHRAGRVGEPASQYALPTGGLITPRSVGRLRNTQHAIRAPLVLRNLWRRRTRTILSVTGIGIGVATLVMLGGMGKSVMGQLNLMAGSGGTGHITLMQKKVADLSLSTLDERMVGQLQSMPGVKSASPFLMGFVMTADMPFFLIGGIDPNSSAMSHYQVIGGQRIIRPNEIMIGKTAAKNYKIGVGGTMTLYDNRYKIVGLYETGVPYEDGGCIMALREAQRLLNRPRSVSFIFVDVTDPAHVDTVRAAMEQRFPDAQVSLSSQFAQETDSQAQMDAFVAAIGILAMLVGGIVVANTMMMSIYERTREIGTLRALGWPKRRILGQVIQESLWLCLIAGLLGSVAGVIMLWGISKLPIVDSMLTATWDAQTFVTSIAVALGVGLVAAFYPAWRASRLRPVEALRYE